MLEGECPKCGAHYVGWSLRFPRNQSCPKCGTGLEIKENGEPLLKGYSPFTAMEHVIEPSSNKRSSKVKSNDTPVKNKKERSR